MGRPNLFRCSKRIHTVHAIRLLLAMYMISCDIVSVRASIVSCFIICAEVFIRIHRNVQFSSEMEVRGQICSRTRGVQVHLMKKETVIWYVVVSTGGDCETNVKFYGCTKEDGLHSRPALKMKTSALKILAF